MPQVVIVGGGISGLALAYRLQQAAPQAEVTVLEREARPGGKVWTEDHAGFRIETGPNGFLDTKPAVFELCRDLGLSERLLAASEASGRNRYLFLGGRLRRLPAGPIDLLRTDILSWRGKLALLAEPFRRRADRPDESVADFARRRLGREVAGVLVDAFVTGIYAGDPERLSLPAAFPRLAAFEAEYGSILKGFLQSARQRRRDVAARGRPSHRPGKMWSFPEGLRLLIETLSQRLRNPPQYSVHVRRIEPQTDGHPGWLVIADGHDAWPADAVVLACPAPQQAAILARIDDHLAAQIDAIRYARVAVLAFGYRQADVPLRLDGFGYLTPRREGRDVLGVQWCSSTFPNRAPDGMVLLRAMCGGWSRPEVVGWDDARLLQAAAGDLRQAIGIRAPPAFHQIIRWDRAIPQYQLGHRERVAAIEANAARHPGLFLAGNAYHGVSLNDCTEQAAVVAGRVAGFLREACPGQPAPCVEAPPP